MLKYTCIACQKGLHDLCHGRRAAPPGVMGGSECVCKGGCEPRTVGKVVEDAERLEAAFNESRARDAAAVSPVSVEGNRDSAVSSEARPDSSSEVPQHPGTGEQGPKEHPSFKREDAGRVAPDGIPHGAVTAPVSVEGEGEREWTLHRRFGEPWNVDGPDDERGPIVVVRKSDLEAAEAEVERQAAIIEDHRVRLDDRARRLTEADDAIEKVRAARDSAEAKAAGLFQENVALVGQRDRLAAALRDLHTAAFGLIETHGVAGDPDWQRLSQATIVAFAALTGLSVLDRETPNTTEFASLTAAAVSPVSVGGEDERGIPVVLRAHDAYCEPLDGGYAGFQARCWDCDWTGTRYLRGSEQMGTDASRAHKENARREAAEHMRSSRVRCCSQCRALAASPSSPTGKDKRWARWATAGWSCGVPRTATSGSSTGRRRAA